MKTHGKRMEYRWWILILATLTNTVVVALPSMSLPVLFERISSDLHLSLVQVGVIWGIGALPGLITTLLSGGMGDRFGPRRILILGCLLNGIMGALRGFSTDYTMLLATVVLSGFLVPFVSISTVKTCGVWFPPGQMGLANGFLSMGMALGFLGGSLLSGTVIAPLVGGWRGVLILYGFLGLLFTLPWYLTKTSSAHPNAPQPGGAVSMRAAFLHVARRRNIWLLGLAILGVGGCVQGTLGYLALYLQGQGWSEIGADGALAMFHMLSMLTVLPVAIYSDRPGLRKKIFLTAACLIASGVGLLALAGGAWVWAAVALAGLMRDGFMAVLMTSIIETDGIGPLYAGSAVGFVMIFSGIGSIFAPPLGNSLASLSPSTPFVFWALLACLGILAITLTRSKQPVLQALPAVDTV